MRGLLLATAALALSSLTAAAADLPVQPSSPKPYVEQVYPQPQAYYAEPCCVPDYYVAPPYPWPFIYRRPFVFGRPFFYHRPFFYGRAFFGHPRHYW